MPETTYNAACPVCRRQGVMSTTKTTAKAWQYAVTCPLHGRIQSYWSTTLAGAAGKGACDPAKKVKRASAQA